MLVYWMKITSNYNHEIHLSLMELIGQERVNLFLKPFYNNIENHFLYIKFPFSYEYPNIVKIMKKKRRKKEH